MLKYDLYTVQKFLHGLSVLTETNVSLYDKDFTPLPRALYPFTEQNGETFCAQIKTAFADKCTQSDLHALQSFPKNENIYYYACHCGFIEVACRIDGDDGVMGYALIGPFRTKNQTHNNGLTALCEKYRFQNEEMQKKYERIPYFSNDTFYALKNVCLPLFDYMKLKNYISQKEDFFALNIEPYLLSHLDGELSVQALCEHFFISRKTLYKLFQRNVQTTPAAYVTKLRIECARRLMQATDQPLPSISSAVGISDYNYFIKLFKSSTGQTPGEYRKHNKKN